MLLNLYYRDFKNSTTSVFTLVSIICCCCAKVTTKVTNLEKNNKTSRIDLISSEFAMRELWKPRKLYKSPQTWSHLNTTIDTVKNNQTIKHIKTNSPKGNFTKGNYVKKNRANDSTDDYSDTKHVNTSSIKRMSGEVYNLTKTTVPWIKNLWYGVRFRTSTAKPNSTTEKSDLKHHTIEVTEANNTNNITLLGPKWKKVFIKTNERAINSTHIISKKPRLRTNNDKVNATTFGLKNNTEIKEKIPNDVVKTYKKIKSAPNKVTNKLMSLKGYLRTGFKKGIDLSKDSHVEKHEQPAEKTKKSDATCCVKKKHNKYILIWSYANDDRFPLTKGRNKCFDKTEREIPVDSPDHKCKYTNCFVTYDKSLAGDYTDFDVIAFGLNSIVSDNLPLRRSPHQKFVFVSSEPRCQIPSEYIQRYDGFFNWTWTYRLDSDLRWGGHFVIRDIKTHCIIGPNTNMHWKRRENMLNVSDPLRRIVYGKTKAVAWFLSTCETPSKREIYGLHLKTVLKSFFNLDLDIYGKCGDLECIESSCDELLREKYFFYLAYERVISEDYVTDTVLHALNFNAVPIVYGGADYGRFLPDGSYLNANEFDVYTLSYIIHGLMNNREQYLLYFKWTNHYIYESTSSTTDSDDHCRMCELLNDKKKMQKVSIRRDVTKWWRNEIKKPQMLRDYHCHDEEDVNARRYLNIKKNYGNLVDPKISGFHPYLLGKPPKVLNNVGIEPIFRPSKAKFQKRPQQFKTKPIKNAFAFHSKYYLDNLKTRQKLEGNIPEKETEELDTYHDTNNKDTALSKFMRSINDFFVKLYMSRIYTNDDE